jgi:hypothetical protein
VQGHRLARFWQLAWKRDGFPYSLLFTEVAAKYNLFTEADFERTRMLGRNDKWAERKVEESFLRSFFQGERCESNCGGSSSGPRSGRLGIRPTLREVKRPVAAEAAVDQ